MSEEMPSYDSIAAIIPYYTAKGDTTAIITTDGKQKATPTRIKTVIKHLARSTVTDLIALKQKAASATERTMFQPLSLAPGLVLCPMKTRIPRIAGDTSTGYINFHAITCVAENNMNPYQAVVTLRGDTDIPVLWTCSTVKKHLQYAKLAMAHTTSYSGSYPDIMALSQKLVEVIYDILLLKSKKE